MRSLIIGGDSSLSLHLASYLESKEVVILRTSRRPDKKESLFLDLEYPNDFKVPKDIDTAFIMAGISGTAVNQNTSHAYKVNVLGTQVVISRLLQQGIRVIFFSTSSVFSSSSESCSEDSEVNPKTHYGEQKHLIEKLFSRERNFCVIRTSKVVYPDCSLIKNWTTLTLKGKPLMINPIAQVAPIGINFFLRSTFNISQLKESGIFHLSGSKLMTFLELAQLVENLLNLNKSFSYMLRASGGNNKSTSAILSMVRTKDLLGITPQTECDFSSDFKICLERGLVP